ncbi:NAD(P)/FAD-dependent oxidoreductase [Oceanospirillum sediminis]|uniref:FAD-binding oxidoreductase n=1 Tax=Oceanospirillum sediminis TaxID=2760088 RepID=A0A839IUY6_9GAMM|nr:FAD-binding oxidoreductase [Oceanospirillum sediminis]MBB1488502.1 FAD-binding oxidoreductase [Oceanospirillum sediminis]
MNRNSGNSKVKLPADDQSNGWYEILTDQAPSNPLKGSDSTDWLVIGGGFVGMAATRRLAELNPNQKVMLADAQRIGHGTSGRNSGFIIDLPHKGDLEGPDIERKRKFIGLNRAAIEYMEKQVTTHGIECQWSHAGKIQGAVSERGIKFLEHFQYLLQELGEPGTMLSGAELKKKVGTDYYQQALFTPGCILMQPAALMRGLLDTLPDNAICHEDTPILGLEQRGKRWVAKTRHGEIHADKVLLGTNIFTEQFGLLTSRMLPIMTFASMTRPLTEDEFKAFGGSDDWGLTPADYAGTTLRFTQDRRMIVRNQYRFVPNYSSTGRERQHIREKHRDAFLARYPKLSHVPFEYTWGGVCTLSSNYTSFFGELKPGLFASCCHNGVGAARGTISGKLLAELASDGDSQLQRDMLEVSGMPAWIPPEPFLGVGVRTRLKMAEWVSRSEI